MWRLVTLVDADPDRDEDALRDEKQRRADAERERVHSVRLVKVVTVVTCDVIPVGRRLSGWRFVTKFEFITYPDDASDHDVIIVFERFRVTLSLVSMLLWRHTATFTTSVRWESLIVAVKICDVTVHRVAAWYTWRYLKNKTKRCVKAWKDKTFVDIFQYKGNQYEN